MKQDKWTQQLHDKLAEHETPAPADLWADIEAALPTSGGSNQASQQHSSRFATLRRWAMAASVAILLGGGALLWWGQEQQPSESLVSMAEDFHGEQHKEPQHEDLQTAGSSGATAPLPSRDRVYNSSPTVAQAIIPENTEEAQPPTLPLEVNGVSEQEATHDDQPTVEAPNNDQPTTEDTHNDQPTVEDSHNDQPLPARPATNTRPSRPVPRRLTLGLYAMNSFDSPSASNAVQMDDVLAQSYDNTYAAGQAASRQAPIFLTGYEERQHHYQPIAFGLTLSYPLSARLSLTSGVVYTRLKSEFTQVIHSQQIGTDQTLHYVGIPLSANYRLWQYKGLSVYLSAGMQADWNVKAQLSTEGVEQEMDRDRLQWSLGGSLGLQYDVLPRLSLYAEPGVTHYFGNGSPVRNFFKDKPTSLKLQFGVRVNLQ